MIARERIELESLILAKQKEIHSHTAVGFAPIARHDARILILGSLPGRRSLMARQYYAHPQNSFWRIMRELTGADGPYQQRCDALLDCGIALWDVLAESVRHGSMDAAIDLKTAEANDFAGFFSRYPDIRRVCFNGKKAAWMFQRFVILDDSIAPRRFETLPSTSAAYAAMTYDAKLVSWRKAIMS
jgi:hypoxanthine-DNA glycosylase